MDRRTFVMGAGLTAAQARRAAGANDRIAVAVIGCGDRNLLAEVLQFGGELNVEAAAVCDTWRQQREKAAARVKEATAKEPKQFVLYQDVLASKEIDAVLISTPDHQHCTQLSAAIGARKDVYVE
jgi:predicted dehydrogenase